ncbi:MAG TPA: hypothetical protein VLK33_03545 [Terriglobales bacterium]|nr:hypothetical protein [Terriglobales bacterium]
MTRSQVLLKIAGMKMKYALAACLVLLLGTAFAQQDDEDQLSKLNFVVLKDSNGKPVRNASVVLHPVGSKGKQQRGGIELKCDANGKASYDGVPYGKLRVQVLNPGFQTFGEDYEVEKPEMEIVIKLKRPVGQYSIYTDNKNDLKGEQPAPEPKKEETKSTKDKPQ